MLYYQPAVSEAVAEDPGIKIIPLIIANQAPVTPIIHHLDPTHIWHTGIERHDAVS